MICNDSVSIGLLSVKPDNLTSTYEFLTGFFTKLGYETSVEKHVSSNIHFYLIRICSGGAREDKPDYLVLLDDIDLAEHVGRDTIVLDTSCRVRGKNTLCINNRDPVFIAGVLASLMGIPLEDAVNTVKGENEKKTLVKAYGYVIRTAIEASLKRLA